MDTESKPCRERSVVWVGALALWVAATAWAQSPIDPLPAVQRNAAGGVTLSVRPLDLTPASTIWMFEIVLDTHSEDLGDEFPAAALLVDDRGRTRAPTQWRGDPAGGHHREGTLEFAPLGPRPAWIELRIQRPGEPRPRAFRWNLGEGSR